MHRQLDILSKTKDVKL